MVVSEEQPLTSVRFKVTSPGSPTLIVAPVIGNPAIVEVQLYIAPPLAVTDAVPPSQKVVLPDMEIFGGSFTMTVNVA